MSVNASQQLIPLIYRHLDEHGFHSAALELLRHNPQCFVEDDSALSASLQEIYSSWFKHSKNRHSRSNGGASPPASAKAASKKAKKSAKKPQKQKSVAPKSAKKDKKVAENATPAKMLRKDTREGDSDSDSSLDVEKWKKLALELTDVDIAKMDTINALDSSAPKKRVRTKPNTDTAAKKKSDIEEKAREAKEQTNSSPQKTSSQSTPLTKNLTSDGAATTSPPKETPKKEKIKAKTPAEEKANHVTPEPKKKRKKNEDRESEVKVSRKEKNGTKDNCVRKPAEDVTNCDKECLQSSDEHNVGTAEEVSRKEMKAKKKQKEAADSLDISEVILKDKKAKKKKKNKEEEERGEGEGTSEHTPKKKKKRTLHDVGIGQPENPEQTANEQEASGKEETAPSADGSGADVGEKKLKKRKSHPVEAKAHLTDDQKKTKKDTSSPAEEPTLPNENATASGEETAEPSTEMKKKKKKKKKQLLVNTLPLFSLDTPQPPSEKKKKKSKKDSS